MNFVSLFAQSEYYYQYNTSPSESAATAGIIAFLVIFSLVLIVTSYAITSFLLSKILKKAGVEPWRAWVPVYNNWLTLELGGQKGYWAVLAFIPFVSIVSAVFMVIAMYHIGLRFKKDSTFVLIAIFVPLAWYIWLAFDNSKWHGPKPASLSSNSDKASTSTSK